jgi:hypothetical protein
MPFYSVHNAQKFSAVLGTISANHSKTILPTCSPRLHFKEDTLVIRLGGLHLWGQVQHLDLQTQMGIEPCA